MSSCFAKSSSPSRTVPWLLAISSLHSSYAAPFLAASTISYFSLALPTLAGTGKTAGLRKRHLSWSRAQKVSVIVSTAHPGPPTEAETKGFVVLLQAPSYRRSKVDHEVNVGKTTAQIHKWLELQIAEPEWIDEDQSRISPDQIDHVVNLIPKVTPQRESLDSRKSSALPSESLKPSPVLLDEDAGHLVARPRLLAFRCVLQRCEGRTWLTVFVPAGARETINNPEAPNPSSRSHLP